MGYLERIDAYKEDMLKALAESVSKPSVKTDPVKTKDGGILPFGQGVHEALINMLEKGKELGFDVYNDENYAGHIEWKSDNVSDEYFGIVGHLDVVPVDSGWATDPFEMVDKGDGFVYGRGTSDDKGPVVACLYAMKAIREEGIELKNNVRVILGLDEETGDASINYYTERYGHPDMGFTPDGDFPIVNGEMGIMVFDLARKFTVTPGKEDLRLTKFEAGTAHNMVPGEARAVIAGDKKYYGIIADRAAAYAEETGHSIKARKQGSSLIIEAKGVASHGARPQLGVNAISIMMDFLGRISFANEELNDFIAFYNDHIGFDLHGERFGIKLEDNQSGPLILNVGIANINEELASLSINIRFPVTFTDVDLVTGMESCIGSSSIGIITRMVQHPIYMDLKTPMVSKLLKAYRDETGDCDTPPSVQAGGTYAKMVNNILCYGALFPGEEDTMHQAGEKLSTESFMKMARIYARAIYALCCE